MERAAKGLYTMIGEGTEFNGTISVPHSIRIDGIFKGGKIQTAEVITIGNTGVVEGDIFAKSAIIGGKVIGNLTAEDRVELDANSSLVGDITTRDLVINEGAVFHGKCTMEKVKGDAV